MMKFKKKLTIICLLYKNMYKLNKLETALWSTDIADSTTHHYQLLPNTLQNLTE